MRKGFTLIELVIVIIILGILAAIGLSQYSKMVEKSRGAEARALLGDLRTAEVAENNENSDYVSVTTLGIGAPDGTCDANHFFSYTCSTTTGACTATRCTASPGKTPLGTGGWTKALDTNGNWTSTTGY